MNFFRNQIFCFQWDVENSQLNFKIGVTEILYRIYIWGDIKSKINVILGEIIKL